MAEKMDSEASSAVLSWFLGASSVCVGLLEKTSITFSSGSWVTGASADGTDGTFRFAPIFRQSWLAASSVCVTSWKTTSLTFKSSSSGPWLAGASADASDRKCRFSSISEPWLAGPSICVGSIKMASKASKLSALGSWTSMPRASSDASSQGIFWFSSWDCSSLSDFLARRSLAIVLNFTRYGLHSAFTMAASDLG